MRSPIALTRVTGAVALIAGLFAALLGMQSVSAQTGDSSIEVHNRVCPADYSGQNWFEDCHANVADPGLPFTFSNGVTRDGTTNENGNVGFGNLPAGTYTITGGAPGDVTDYFVYCSTEGTNEEVPVNYVSGGIQMSLAEGTNVVCDWYTIPLSQNGEAPPATEPPSGDGSIEVHSRICPEGYDGENWYQDCHGNAPDPGLPFTFTNGVTRDGTTNENGNVGFGNLPAGTYAITGGAPGEFTDYFVYCSSEGTGEELPVNYVTGGIQIDLPANSNVVCDWYTIPIGQGPADPTPTEEPVTNSSIEVHNRICPQDYDGGNWFEDCHSNVADPGLPFTFADGVTREGATNDNGNVGFGNLPAGTYAITGGAPGEFTDYFVYCSTEGAGEEVPVNYVTGGIQIDLAASTNVVCDWYTIPLSQNGETPTATEPPAGDGSIEVHNRVCPEGYDGENWFEDCHGNAPDPGLPFTFSDGVTREGETNENGNVGFANLPAGTYTITGGAPGEFTDYFVYCSTEGANEEVAVDYVTGGVEVDLAANTNLVCDWYTIPLAQNGETPIATEPATGNSSIELHHRICPTEYDGDNWFEDCHDEAPDPGLSFTFADGVTREGTTNDEGNIGFANLPAGTYTITGGVPGEFAEHVVYCSVGTAETSDQQPVDVEYVTGGVQFDLPSDTNVICDWYEVPYDLQGDPTATQPNSDQFDLPVYKLLCDTEPDGQAVGDFVTVGTVPEGCDQFAGAEVTVTDGAGTELGICVTEGDDPCYVTVPVGSVVYGTEDVDTVPEGYEPTDGETIEVLIEPATEASLLFINVADQQADMFDLPIYALQCDSEPGAAVSDFVMGGIMPEGCEQYGGASVTVTTPDGDPYGTCETGANAPCYVNVEVGTTVLATVNPATLPADHAPVIGETQEIEIVPASEAWVVFVAVPAVQTPEPQPTETPVPIETPVFPDTPDTPQTQGRTLAIHEGTCAPGEPGDTVVELPDLTGPDRGSDTDTDVIVAETSTSTIAPTLDELTGSEHALIAYSDEEASTPIACTEIAGEVNTDGELVIGVHEVNDSGYAGIAYLASTADTGETRISVFLAEDIADNDDAESTMIEASA